MARRIVRILSFVIASAIIVTVPAVWATSWTPKPEPDLPRVATSEPEQVSRGPVAAAFATAVEEAAAIRSAAVTEWETALASTVEPASVEPVSPPEPAPAPAPPVSVGGTPPECVKQKESGGDYSAVNPAGPYGGAWQFLQSTWDSTARSAGRPDLVGIPPQHASPADQDAMAAALWAGGQGASHWPTYPC